MTSGVGEVRSPPGRWISRVSLRHNLTLLEKDMLTHLERAGVPEEVPALCLRWMRSIARRLDSDRRRLAVMTTRRLDAQVAFILLEQQEPEGTASVVRLTHEVIADLVGARRQSVSRVLRELASAGYVSGGYGQVQLLDIPALELLLGGDRPVMAAR